MVYERPRPRSKDHIPPAQPAGVLHLPCRWCGRTFPSPRGLFVHQGHIHQAQLGGTCRIEGCDRPREAKPGGASYTLCRSHRRHPDAPIIERRTPGPADAISYKTAHGRVRKARGPASDHRCVDCDGRAQEWSFNPGLTGHVISGVETDGRTGASRPMDWSADVAAYQARCMACHARFDADRAHPERYLAPELRRRFKPLPALPDDEITRSVFAWFCRDLDL